MPARCCRAGIGPHLTPKSEVAPMPKSTRCGRRRKPAKPRPDFPLYVHATGRCRDYYRRPRLAPLGIRPAAGVQERQRIGFHRPGPGYWRPARRMTYTAPSQPPGGAAVQRLVQGRRRQSQEDHRGPTPEQAWQSRQPISFTQRSQLNTTVDRYGQEERIRRGIPDEAVLGGDDHDDRASRPFGLNSLTFARRGLWDDVYTEPHWQ
jgi:hypothetical protein